MPKIENSPAAVHPFGESWAIASIQFCTAEQLLFESTSSRVRSVSIFRSFVALCVCVWPGFLFVWSITGSTSKSIWVKTKAEQKTVPHTAIEMIELNVFCTKSSFCRVYRPCILCAKSIECLHLITMTFDIRYRSPCPIELKQWRANCRVSFFFFFFAFVSILMSCVMRPGPTRLRQHVFSVHTHTHDTHPFVSFDFNSEHSMAQQSMVDDHNSHHRRAMIKYYFLIVSLFLDCINNAKRIHNCCVNTHRFVGMPFHARTAYVPMDGWRRDRPTDRTPQHNSHQPELYYLPLYYGRRLAGVACRWQNEEVLGRP